ncbi:hypothetical protein [Candidatus Amarobacter glycogenicus]|uniref:hypothetical protein n=1 Tax=Candidatus Amarobacter glycogenicus TaxID=3140699 RepID=UPI002A12F19F|nr:hypothetical protein [Dehalococcoidia bacterium]
MFDGTLAPGESVAPEYTVPSGTLDFNFALAVIGADVDLTITDGSSGIVWDDSALDGETVWGTGTLTGKNIIHLTNNGAASATISLVFYHLPTAAYTWDGLAAPTGAESHIRLIPARWVVYVCGGRGERPLPIPAYTRWRRPHPENGGKQYQRHVLCACRPARPYPLARFYGRSRLGP